jgi:hypothetical protein
MARWSLSATPPYNPSAGVQASDAGTSTEVNIVLQNYSAAPLDIFLEVAPGDPAFVETLAANQEISLRSQVGVRWQLSQNEQWVGAFTATSQSQQVVPYGR